MKVIVGLGNWGKKYDFTRHNVGFIALDQLCETVGECSWKEESKFQAIISDLNINNQKKLLVKPTTFMNLSGQAVTKILNYYNYDANDLLVIYDDIDLPLGTIRFRKKGSAGSHNGMKSIISHLGTTEFKRLRIGIENRGEEAKNNQSLSSYVLNKFTKSEKALLDQSLTEAITKIISLTES